MTLSRFCFFAAVFFSLPAFAGTQGPLTAIQLQDMCNSRYDVEAGMCAGYVTAVAERLMGESDPRTHVCLSPAISPQTLVDNLKAVWGKQPPETQEFASTSVELALRQQFQCPR